LKEKSKENLRNDIKDLNKKLEEMQLNADSAHYLIEYNNKFKFIVENMGHGLIFVDVNDIIMYVNKKFCEIVKYKSNELIGKNTDLLLVDSTDRNLLDDKKKLRYEGISDIYRIRNRTKEGDVIWLEVNGTSVTDDEGRMVGTIGIVEDITSKLAEHSRDEKTRKILEAVSLCSEKFLTMEDFNSTVNEVLAILGEASGVDRVCIYENFENKGELVTSQVMEYVAEGITPHLNSPEFQNIPYVKSELERWINTLSNGEAMYGSLKNFPENERKFLESLGLRSVVAIPIFLSGKWWGFLGFDEFNDTREWSLEEIDALKKAASGIGSGLENWLAKNFLKKSEEDFRHLFEYAPTGIVVRTMEGIYMRVNQAFCDMLGYERNDLIGRHFNLVTHPADFHKELKVIEGLINDEKPYTQFEKRYINKNGKIVHAILQISIQRDQSGNPIHLTAHVTDITERKLIESERVNIEKIYRTIFENANDAIFIEDEEENIIDANVHACELTGYTRDELLKMRTVDLQPSEYEKYEMRNDDRFETQVVHKNGKVLNVELTISQIKQGDKVLLISIVRDMTEKKRAEEALKVAKEKAEESDRVKSHFLAQMSHEIRTPINAIVGYSQLIKEELEDKVDEETKSSFEIIESASQRLMRTIDLILRMSEIQTGNYKFIPKEVDLNSQLKNLYKQFKITADRKGLGFELKSDAEDAVVTGDEFSIVQIFSNLIGNALKYTIEGKVFIEINKNGRGAFVRVSDTGIGISKEYIPHIFQIFSQEEQGYTRKFEGNGLGLALVKKYCEMNNADIHVESEKHKGSAFTVYFNENEGGRKYPPPKK
jgi:PAS domain S-box-containing protein